MCFIVESGVDVRMVEGLARIVELTILARRIHGGVEISHSPAVKADIEVGPASRAGFAAFVARHLAAADYGAVLVQGYSAAALAANVVGRATGTPTTMLVCSPIEEYYRCRRAASDPAKPFRSMELMGLKALARANARVGGRYVVLSEHLADVVRRHGGSDIAVVPVYGVDVEVFAPPERPRIELRRDLGLPPTGAIVFFSSRVAPEKDSETLLAAFRRVLDAGEDLWLLHRSGGYRDFMEDADRYGIAERVIAGDAVHPHRELPLLYQASDLCVQASRAEGLGFSALEALATETPVVATAVGGLRETILDGWTGWSYPVGDVEELTRCVLEVLRKPEEAQRRSRQGRKLVIERYAAASAFSRLRDVLTVAARR